MDDFEKELKVDFLNEASDLLTQAEGSFMQLESEPENLTLVDAIFRFAHNLKGTSRAVGFGQIAELTHVAENLLLKIKQGELKVEAHVVDVLLRFNDQVAQMVTGLKENLEASFEVSALVKELSLIASGHRPEGVQAPVAEVMVEAVAQEAAAPQTELEVVEAPSADLWPEEEEGAVMAAPVIAQVVAIEAVKKDEPKPVEVKKNEPKKVENKKDDETIRVSLSRLETLGDLVGELVILQSVVERALAQQPSELKTRRALSKICKDIQDMSMSLRMVPISATFQKLQRIVRDTSKQLNKKVELKIIGEETEVDRTVLERLGDPLVHLIRNAVDHGIEQPHDRLLAGKSEAGTVEVMAIHEGNSLVIQITDDGNGMDPEKLMKKARDKGILRADQVLSDQDSFNLIFHPGFSTKEQVSEVSGRGVGMDVVKTNIEALGGEIRLQSKKGVGSCVRLVLPLTLAIIDGMLISSGGQRLVIPRGQVHEITRINLSDVHMAGGKTPFFRLRDEVLPLFSLSQDMGQRDQKEMIAIVVRSNSHVFAVALEDVLRQQQVVVKPPTPETAGRPGVMGTTILGDGRPALIIDLLDMYGKRGRKEKATRLAA